MTEPLKLYVQGDPVPQGSHMAALTQSGRPYLRESNSQRLRPWRAAIKKAAKEAMARRDKFVGPLAVSLTFALERPKSHAGSRSWPASAPDVDKLCRCWDSLTGVVWYDDGQVVSVSARKVWAEYDVDWLPGVLIWVAHVPGFTPPEPVHLPG